MLAPSIRLISVPIVRSLSLGLQQRTLAVSATLMAEGSTGAPRSGGAAQSDSFTKREKANEDLYVKQKERENLKALKAKLAEQQKHLSELSAHVDEISKNSGGKKN